MDDWEEIKGYLEFLWWCFTEDLVTGIIFLIGFIWLIAQIWSLF